MSAEPKTWRVWLLPVLLLMAVLLGGRFLGPAAQQPRGAKTAESPPPKVPALAPGTALPPSTPALSPPGPNLLGRVVSTQGDPVAGARIFIDAARPRVGRGYT